MSLQLTQERRRDIIDPDAYWTERFRIAESRQPVFLKQWARLISDTGKYINVLQEIGITATVADAAPKLVFSVNERDYALPIQLAHQRASQVLLDLLIRDHGLVQHFTTLKRYFFHEKGDVILQFVDVAEEVRDMRGRGQRGREGLGMRGGVRVRACWLSRWGGSADAVVMLQDLRKEGATLVWPRVQSLLDIAIRTRCVPAPCPGSVGRHGLTFEFPLSLFRRPAPWRTIRTRTMSRWSVARRCCLTCCCT